MPKKVQPILSESLIAENPAVNPEIVKEALQMRQELERLGVWNDSDGSVSSPFEIKPSTQTHLVIRSRFITQKQ